MNDGTWNNPWNAGAQLSHYLFFCKMQGEEERIEIILGELDRYKHEDGWYFNKPPDHVRINGIMKIFTGYLRVDCGVN